MIGICEFCDQPAQWQLRFITRLALTAQERTKKLHPRGPAIENGPKVCNGHKQELEKLPSARETAFTFLGATIGTHHS